MLVFWKTGCLQEVPNTVIWLGKFWYFGKLVAYKRWLRPEVRLYIKQEPKTVFPITLKIIKLLLGHCIFLISLLGVWKFDETLSLSLGRNLFISSKLDPPASETLLVSVNALKWSTTHKQNNNYPTTCVMTLWIMSSILRDWLNTRHLWPSDLRFSKSDSRKVIFPDSWVSTLSEGPNPFGWVANDQALSSSVSNSPSLENENLHYVNNLII